MIFYVVTHSLLLHSSTVICELENVAYSTRMIPLVSVSHFSMSAIESQESYICLTVDVVLDKRFSFLAIICLRA